MLSQDVDFKDGRVVLRSTKDAFSESARKAALEARRKKLKGRLKESLKVRLSSLGEKKELVDKNESGLVLGEGVKIRGNEVSQQRLKDVLKLFPPSDKLSNVKSIVMGSERAVAREAYKRGYFEELPEEGMYGGSFNSETGELLVNNDERNLFHELAHVVEHNYGKEVEEILNSGEALEGSGQFNRGEVFAEVAEEWMFGDREKMKKDKPITSKVMERVFGNKAPSDEYLSRQKKLARNRW